MANGKVITAQFSVTTVERGPQGEQGPAGQEACRLDIANDYDMVPTDSKGKVIQDTYVICAVSFRKGLNTVSVPTLTVDAITVNTNTSLSPTQTSEAQGRAVVLTWHFTEGMVLRDKYDINISCSYGNAPYEATLTIAASKNEPRRILTFTKYVISFARKADNTLDPASKDTKLTITFDDYESTEEKTVAASGLIVRYNTNGTMPASKTAGTAWGTANGASGISFPATDTMRIANGTSVNEISVALFSQSGKLYDRETIPIIKDGSNGDEGPAGHDSKFYWYWGKWSDFTGTVSITDNQTCYFLYSGEYWMWVGGACTLTPAMGPPADGKEGWEKVESRWKYILSEAIFTEFAKLGGFIVTGEWLISMYGTMYNPDNSAVTINSSNYQTNYNGKLPYTWFDSSYPNTSHNNSYNFCPAYAVNGNTGESYMNKAHIRGEIYATSGEFNGTVKVGLIYGSVYNITANFTINPSNHKYNYYNVSGGVTVVLPNASSWPGLELSFVSRGTTRAWVNPILNATNSVFYLGSEESTTDAANSVALGRNKVAKFVSLGGTWQLVGGSATKVT